MFRDRFWVCGALTVPILLLSGHVRAWLGLPPLRFPGSEWVAPVLASVVYVYGAGPFVQGAVREVLRRSPGMMTLVALATTVAYVYSLAVTFGLPGEPFYWELATLVVVMLLGHWIEMRAVQGASRALEHLASLLPPVAHRVRDGEVEDVPVEFLRRGDMVLVRPGEQVPADGVVLEGASHVNEAFLTGESRPVLKEMGSEVVAGSVNGEGALRVRVLRTGEQTTLSQIARLVQEAQAARSRYQALADRAAAWLTYTAVAAGSATFGLWLLGRAPSAFAVERAVTVLVIACPHALGLAIPLVIVNATALAARHGILIRNREAFERARDIRTVAFDKTGTLTEGQLTVGAVYTDGADEAEVLRIAAALEAASEHPFAQAIVEAARTRDLPVEPAQNVRAVPGKGIEGTWNGQVYRVGRPEWAAELGLTTIGERLREGLREAEARGESVVALMDPQRISALLTLADWVRESAREAVRALHAMGRRVVMVTGDAEAVARQVAQDLGIDRFFARVLPQDKARIVRELRAEGPVAFVGDGINDAPALVEADLGIAIGAGTNVAIESADVVLVENDPLDAVHVLRLAEATYGKMVQNLVWATGYNVVAIPLAAGAAYRFGVLLSPAVGALFMSLSTVAVAINAVLLRRVRLSSGS
jgi:Cu2+-exporting ATPase